MQIVEVRSENLSQAAAVHSISWRESHRSFCTPEFIEMHTPQRQRDYLLGKMNGGGRVYMLVDGEPIGVVSVCDNLIEDLYVLPDRQNRGYGTALLRFAIEKCAGTPTLWILENNAGAERLYLRMGFQRTGRRKMIREGLDEIEFSL